MIRSVGGHGRAYQGRIERSVAAMKLSLKTIGGASEDADPSGCEGADSKVKVGGMAGGMCRSKAPSVHSG